MLYTSTSSATNDDSKLSPVKKDETKQGLWGLLAQQAKAMLDESAPTEEARSQPLATSAGSPVRIGHLLHGNMQCCLQILLQLPCHPLHLSFDLPPNISHGLTSSASSIAVVLRPGPEVGEPHVPERIGRAQVRHGRAHQECAGGKSLLLNSGVQADRRLVRASSRD